MPVDEAGNRADIVVGAESTVSRMNLGRLYEHYFNAAARDMCKRIQIILGTFGKTTPEKVASLPEHLIESAYNTLLDFYNIISEKQYNFFSKVSQEQKYEHIADILNEGVVKLFIPTDNNKDIIEVITELERKYPPTYGPVKYVGNSGKETITNSKIRIAPLYMMLLDKTADEWSSVATGKLQHFGVLSPPTKSEKFSNPYRNSPVRTIGETEGRIFAGYCGREAIAEMMDRSNAPMTQRNMVWNILNAPQPTNIDKVVNRDYVPLGSSRPLQLVKHILGVSGLELVYEPENVKGKE